MAATCVDIGQKERQMEGLHDETLGGRPPETPTHPSVCFNCVTTVHTAVQQRANGPVVAGVAVSTDGSIVYQATIHLHTT